MPVPRSKSRKRASENMYIDEIGSCGLNRSGGGAMGFYSAEAARMHGAVNGPIADLVEVYMIVSMKV